MQRFYTPLPLAVGSMVELSVDQQHQIRHVLRLTNGTHIELIDGQSDAVYEAEILFSGRKVVNAQIISQSVSASRTHCRLSLAVAQIQSTRFEWLVQKATELGVSEIIPIRSARTQQRPERSERWKKIAVEAVEQSKQTRIPQIAEPTTLLELMSHREEEWIIAAPGATLTLVDYFKQTKSVDQYGLLIGPEGGWTGDELSLVAEQGVVSVSLGPTILRSETAAVVGSALVLTLSSSAQKA